MGNICTKCCCQVNSFRNAKLSHFYGVGFCKTNEEMYRLDAAISNGCYQFPSRGIYLSVGGERSLLGAKIFSNNLLQISSLVVVDIDSRVLDYVEKLYVKIPKYQVMTNHTLATFQLDLKDSSSWDNLLSYLKRSRQHIAVLDLSNTRQSDVQPKSANAWYPGNQIDLFISKLRSFFVKQTLVIETILDCNHYTQNKKLYDTEYVFHCAK